MDPNAALSEIRELIAKAKSSTAIGMDAIDRLVELISGLDNWITNGGFAPDAWNRRKMWTEKKIPDLPPGVWRALARYAEEHGRNWRADLARDWERGGDTAELRHARNVLGPSGLRKLSTAAVSLAAEAAEPVNDFGLEDHGTVWLVRSRTPDALRHLREHVQEEDAQWMGDALVVEARYVGDLASSLRDDGFSVGR